MNPVRVAILGAGGQLGRTLMDEASRKDRQATHKETLKETRQKAHQETRQGTRQKTHLETHEESSQESSLNPITGNSVGKTRTAPVSLHPFSRRDLDICDPEQLEARLAPLSPQVIINTAAYTKVDQAETDSVEAFRVNRDGAEAVAAWAAANGCRLIHVSTDFVFDGRASTPYRPDAATGPLSQYGASKLAGEERVRARHPEGAIIIRTGWLYSVYPPNFVATMLRLMGERDTVSVVADQKGTPTSTRSLAALIQKAVTGAVGSGCFHWSDGGEASWYDFAVAIQEEALAAGLLSRAATIRPITTADYPTPATRPAYSVLDKSETRTRFALEPQPWRDELRRVIRELSKTAGN